MRIKDKKSLPWGVGSAVVLLVATAGFILCAHFSPRASRGGSWPGLIFGSVGSLLIIVALLLSLRKRLRTWRVGRALQWTQAHVWLGTLSYPIILYHAAGHWGGPLTQVLMWIFTVVWVSGIVGLIFQQYVPDMLIRAVPSETVFDQVDHVIGQLRVEAEALIEGAGRGRVPATPQGEGHGVLEAPEMGDLRVEGEEGGSVAVLTEFESTARLRETELIEGRRVIQAFYEKQVRPLLQPRYPRGLPLAALHRSDAEFLRLRNHVPKILHETVDDLKAVVGERRQLQTQRRLHRVLHSWLLIHVPLSFAMFLLAIVHAFTALRYASLGGW